MSPYRRGQNGSTRNTTTPAAATPGVSASRARCVGLLCTMCSSDPPSPGWATVADVELILAEELLLLYRNEKGQVGFPMDIDPGLAGALLVDLGRLGAPRLEDDTLQVASQVEIEHPVLARVHAATIAASNSSRLISEWIILPCHQIKPLPLTGWIMLLFRQLEPLTITVTGPP